MQVISQLVETKKSNKKLMSFSKEKHKIVNTIITHKNTKNSL